MCECEPGVRCGEERCTVGETFDEDVSSGSMVSRGKDKQASSVKRLYGWEVCNSTSKGLKGCRAFS